MSTMMIERYAVEEGEEDDNVSYTSFKTISTVKTSDGEQTKFEEKCNSAFTSYQTISTIRTWNEEDDTQAEDSTDSPCVSQSSVISTCRKGATSPDGIFKRSKVDGSLFNVNQTTRTFQVLGDVEEHISGSSCGSCPDPFLKQASPARAPPFIRYVSQSSVISTCRKGATSPDGISFKRSKVDGSLFNVNQTTRTFQVLEDVEEHISGSSCGPCSDLFFKKASPTRLPALINNKGDRIEALHQLVSPFGKGDTASVLMESIGYIKFLQDQVEGLLRMTARDDIELDLKSHGLCLVPTSCTPRLYREYAFLG